jgi:lipopolysaccharide transport system ATP-binding protein
MGRSLKGAMKDSIIVEGLSKKYEIGAQVKETMLRERIISLLTSPFRKKAPSEIIWALRDVSFRVPEGQVLGIVGRNGAGKSSLLKVLSKITYPTEGKFQINGRVASLLEVGTGFHEELTGRENIYLNGSILGMKRKEVEARLDAIVEFAGVDKFIDTPIKRYSSGMRLRLGFAVAAHLDPDILIVDEVLAVGDAGFQKKCLAAMEGLRSGGRTVLFVSHNMAAVENLCSRAIWIDNGRIRSDGDAGVIIKQYLSSFTPSSAASSSFDGVEGRLGSGEIRYTGFQVLSPQGEPVPLVRSGDSVTFRLQYNAKAPIQNPSFGFRIYTEMGTLITDTSTWHHAMDIPVISPGDGFLDLEIDCLNLMPGRYVLSLWLTGQGRHIYDALENSLHLDVETTNIYNASRISDSRYGIVFFPQRWRLNPTSGASPAASRNVSEGAEEPDSLLKR